MLQLQHKTTSQLVTLAIDPQAQLPLTPVLEAFQSLGSLTVDSRSTYAKFIDTSITHLNNSIMIDNDRVTASIWQKKVIPNLQLIKHVLQQPKSSSQHSNFYDEDTDAVDMLPSRIYPKSSQTELQFRLANLQDDLELLVMIIVVVMDVLAKIVMHAGNEQVVINTSQRWIKLHMYLLIRSFQFKIIANTTTWTTVTNVKLKSSTSIQRYITKSSLFYVMQLSESQLAMIPILEAIMMQSSKPSSFKLIQVDASTNQLQLIRDIPSHVTPHTFGTTIPYNAIAQDMGTRPSEIQAYVNGTTVNKSKSLIISTLTQLKRSLPLATSVISTVMSPLFLRWIDINLQLSKLSLPPNYNGTVNDLGNRMGSKAYEQYQASKFKLNAQYIKVLDTMTALIGSLQIANDAKSDKSIRAFIKIGVHDAPVLLKVFQVLGYDVSAIVGDAQNYTAMLQRLMS
ncbi:Hypothetical protein MVR_LOCUS125 [uncultured virus]|nr:Hypothetical protein MVR_LOCUS125 [uncultured virus]